MNGNQRGTEISVTLAFLPHRQTVLSARGVGKSYAQAKHLVTALEDISFDVRQGEFVSVIGQSGCGKSTLLRLIAGLDAAYEGRIDFEGAPIAGPSLRRGIVFQEHRLFPWLTIEQNVRIAVHEAPLSAPEKDARVRARLKLVGLAGFEEAFPHQLSGGMLQRASIARALVAEPDLLLLDEPFGALDAFTRIHLQHELSHVWERQAIAMIMVTHEIEEALFLSDTILILSPRPGRLKKVVPVDLPRPRDRAGAHFTALKSLLLAELGLTNSGLQPETFDAVALKSMS